MQNHEASLRIRAHWLLFFKIYTGTFGVWIHAWISRVLSANWQPLWLPPTSQSQSLVVRLLNNGLCVKSCCLMALVDQPWSCLALNTQDTIWHLGGYIMLAVYEKETPVWSRVKVTVGILWLLLCSLNTYCLSICCKQFVFLLISSFRKAAFLMRV